LTAEVVIMNRRAVVLAADSAVTVPTFENGMWTNKYFKGANKVFELSNFEPIGVMIFNLSDLEGVPWEIIIKSYREQLGPRSFKTIEEYASDLFAYVQKHPTLFPQDTLRDGFFRQYKSVFSKMWLAIEADPVVKAVHDQPNRMAVDLDAARKTVIDKAIAHVASVPLPDFLPGTTPADIWTECGQELSDGVVTVLKEFDCNLPADDITKLVIDILLKNYREFLPYTGIVVTGYGDDSHFPGCVEHKCAGFLWTHLVVEAGQSDFIKPWSTGIIRPFAQDNMASTFMFGAGNDFLSVKDWAGQMINNLATQIDASHSVPAQDISNMAAPLVEDFMQRIINHQIEKHYGPLMQAVGFLPVDEMAHLAETLIMLESLKEKVTHPSQSVGGAIDVAVITKAEGLVWVKRKHYFPSELNSRFMVRQSERLDRNMHTRRGNEHDHDL